MPARGEILIHKHVTVGDVGKALNPLQVEMQDEGAAIMGLGHSMMEHLMLGENGEIRNLGALDYRIPTSKDMPLVLETGIVENGDGPGPFGSKGVSEGAILCTAPALASAVAQATGVEITDLPLTPERVWPRVTGAAIAHLAFGLCPSGLVRGQRNQAAVAPQLARLMVVHRQLFAPRFFDFIHECAFPADRIRHPGMNTIQIVTEASDEVANAAGSVQVGCLERADERPAQTQAFAHRHIDRFRISQPFVHQPPTLVIHHPLQADC